MGQCTSSFFTISNGVRQGCVLSPGFSSIYIDVLSILLSKSNVGCFIDKFIDIFIDIFIDFIYADDICIFGPSPSGIGKLLSIYDTFGRTNFIIFNPSKSGYILQRGLT